MKLVCGICGGPVTCNRNKGLGTYHCTKGCKKPRMSTNKGGAFNRFIDVNKISKVTAPVHTGFSYTPVRVVG